MNRSCIALSLAPALAVASVSACAVSDRVSSIQSSADTDSYRVWIALLKGFEGNVFYVGSDDTYAYFRIGTVFRSYHKLPICAVQLPETYPLQAGRIYIVRFHVQADNSIHMEGTCTNYDGHVLGQLDRVK